MIDEMYLEKATQYHSGVHIAADDEGNLYKGIVAFMIVGLKELIPYTAQSTLEVKFSGEWLLKKCQIALMILHQENFVYEVSSLKTTLQIYMHFLHSLQFSILIHNFLIQYINHAGNFGKKTYLHYDTVHIMKNIRNNLLNGEKFVFPEFIYNVGLNINIDSPAGFIQRRDLNDIYDKYKGLSANLNNAPKLSYQALHLRKNKQSVPLALAIIHETTIAAARSHFPTRSDLSGVLNLINIWRTISNSTERYTPNVLGNAIIFGDKKTDYYRIFAD